MTAPTDGYTPDEVTYRIIVETEPTIWKDYTFSIKLNVELGSSLDTGVSHWDSAALAIKDQILAENPGSTRWSITTFYRGQKQISDGWHEVEQ
jgi:hypothetical protein